LSFPPQDPRRLAQRGQRDGRIQGIQDAIHGSPARLHAGGHLGYGKGLLPDEFLDLDGEGALEGEGFDLLKHALVLQKSAQITSAVTSCAHDVRRIDSCVSLREPVRWAASSVAKKTTLSGRQELMPHQLQKI